MRKRILWIDDEIEFLRSHIVFLETRGYAVIPASGGDEAIRLIRESPAFDIVLLDKQMPAKSGNSTLDEIKAHWPGLPVVMLTGYRHNADIALRRKYDAFLSKPIDNNELLQACRRIIDAGQRADGAPSDKYFRSYTENRTRLDSALAAPGLIDIYGGLARWDAELEGVSSEGVRQMHTGLKSDCCKKFCDAVAENYAEWVGGGGPDRPMMSADVVKRAVAPELAAGRSVIMAVLSGMRLDRFAAIEPEIKRNFAASFARFLAALPTLPAVSLPVLVSGLYPGELGAMEQGLFDFCGDGNYGWRPEFDPVVMKRIMRAGLERAGAPKAKTYYASADGANGRRHIRAALNAVKKGQTFGVLTIDAAKTAPPDAAPRRQTAEWFAASGLLAALRETCGESCTVILTSDHGRVQCARASEIYEVAKIGENRRCLFTAQAAVDEREALVIEEPAHFKMPPQPPGTKCVMAREDYYLALHGKRGQGAGSFQSGGVSLEEMVMPVYVCRPKNGD